MPHISEVWLSAAFAEARWSAQHVEFRMNGQVHVLVDIKDSNHNEKKVALSSFQRSFPNEEMLGRNNSDGVRRGTYLPIPFTVVISRLSQ